MTDFRICACGVGFAAVACLSTVALGQGGDTVGTAVPLALNTTTTGTTAGYFDDADEVCPYTGSTSPDVFYTYSPATTHSLTVDLCLSAYDTKTYVWDSLFNLLTDSVVGNPACNDDACSDAGGNPFRSQLNCITVNAGQQYYIVVDGFGGDAGTYTITTSITPGSDAGACDELDCSFDCAIGDQLEGETCDDTFAVEDCYNGGCNCVGQDISNPTAFVDISCLQPICGTSNYNGTTRDTDWYRYTNTTIFNEVYIWNVECEFEGVIGRVENFGANDCTPVNAFAEVAVGALPCDPLQTTSVSVPPGVHYFFVGPNFTNVFTCIDDFDGTPLDYRATLECEPQAPECPWDFNGNDEVDFQDLLKILANWGPCPGVP